ncbi:15863_t:CDS:2 [Funneliformis mosseae]|uniref:15863_t:CDS:1 n=1 Tax=Funneliformis mosseae TaxID=27381 RepID=A0A9N9D7S2_FUNMO|nr:15863_t:CDS:2 [Funneliformis mosseae]
MIHLPRVESRVISFGGSFLGPKRRDGVKGSFPGPKRRDGVKASNSARPS